MILRSVVKHVTQQNWLAVGIDFVIVVVGVFIGIQVANWNEALNESILERVLIESLQRDFERIVEDDNERYERTIAAPINLGRLIDAIRDGEEPADSIVWPGLEAGLLAYAPTPPSPTYDELLSTGRLSRLTNVKLRRQLTEFERSRLNEGGLGTHLTEMSYGSPLYTHVELDTRDTGLGVSGSFRWDGLAEALPHLQERLLLLHAQANWRRNSRRNAQDVLQFIEEELD